jgi:hypothetical protein
MGDYDVKSGSPEKMDVNELLELFYHLDKIHAGKENLFIPLSLSIFPAVLISWGKIDVLVLLSAALVSIAIYVYHILVTSRFSSMQTKIFRAIFDMQGGEGKSLLHKIVSGEEMGQIRVSILRRYFLVAVILLWVLLFVLKLVLGSK